MCRQAVTGFGPSVRAPRDARAFVTALCARWELQPLADEAALVVSELVTNAVLHAKSHVEVSVWVVKDTLEMAVRDSDPRPPVLRPMRTNLLADLDALAGTGPPPHNGAVDERHPSLHVGRSGSVAAGRGLLIVDALADEWGVTERADGKQVWLKLGYPEWAHVADCSCQPTDDLTASGTPVRHMPGPWDADLH